MAAKPKPEPTICRALTGVGPRAGGADARTERCRNKATGHKHGYPLCRVHTESVRILLARDRGGAVVVPYVESIDPDYIAPQWWLWPDALLGRLRDVISRSGVDDAEQLIKNLEARIDGK